jgi:hypothetical protein
MLKIHIRHMRRGNFLCLILIIRLVHNNTTITSKLYKTLHTALHTKKLQQHIMKKHSLPPQAFNLIRWEAHEKSFTNLSRIKKSIIAN